MRFSGQCAAGALVAASLLLAASAQAAPPAAGADVPRVTPKEAEAMVRKGVAHIKANPRDKALADISDRNGQFVDRELYLTVYTPEGVAVAHGANPKFIGKNMLSLRDPDGKEIIRERLELAKAKAAFWEDFKFVNPVNKKIEPKQMYCEHAAELVVCGGVYKPN